MSQSPFHHYLTARDLSVYADSMDKLTAAYASSKVEVYPYQVAAALFALRSPYLKGVILADEGSLGKTYEALLVISQLWFEGKERILLVVPTPLLGQWIEVMDDCFTVPYITIDSAERYAEVGGDNPFDQPAIILTTYDFAVAKADDISRIVWETAAFEEAHRLANPENKTTIVLKEAVGDAYKILLTATPMQKDIMDLYGIVSFIDDSVLGDADAFYKRYFRKPELYHELTSRVSRYVFRTLRSQVESYVKIPRRLPVTTDYPLSSDEIKLKALVDAYLAKPEKQAFPKMDAWELTLMFNRALASSPFALCSLADTAYGRVQESELKEMAELAASIKPETTGKGNALLKALKRAFVELKKKGAQQKVIIFTESKATLGFLHVLLSNTYKTLAFDGTKSSDYSVIKKFEADTEILITTDIAAEGFCLGFCSFLINFDMPYNALTLEQRILRCHRQGQHNDLIVLNFLSKHNMADTRVLELINKRVLQFDGIMGMSDDVVGNFADNAVDGVVKAFEAARHTKDIEAEYRATLNACEDTNIAEVSEAENILFTTFTRDIAARVTITPQYIKDRTAELNKKLWELVVVFLEGHGYDVDHVSRSAVLPADAEPSRLFYYWTGTRNKPYTGLKSYGAGTDFKPAAGRVTLASPIGRGVLHNIECADEGTLTVEGATNCTLALYAVNVSEKGSYGEYVALAGKTADGVTLNEAECREVMGLPVVECTEGEHKSPCWLRSSGGRGRPCELDRLIDTEYYKNLAIAELNDARSEEIESVQDRAYHKKQVLNRDISVLKNQLLQIDNALSRSGDVADKIDAEKKKASASKELKQREQTLFMDGLRVDVEAEEAVKKLTDGAKISVNVQRQFVIDINGRLS